ncbi:MAG: MFS transporter [Euryarchaeota archaeon]|nr:MFS transporter [Euryarchaeota archaeon]MDE1836990.1 MFS transporter [Euryarchaeota archaeon]MDE1881567.1 MFS transporter [Euryarchaeota archaeon]MDE2046366.1 MFS transporter [Thermoplasmata archaeon]
MAEPSSHSWGPLLRRRPFALLFSARTVARFGNNLGAVALVWYVYSATRSPIALTLVGLAELLPSLTVGLFAGALVDRFDRRRTSGLTTLGRALSMAVLVGATIAMGFHLTIVLAVVVVFSLLSSFMGPATTVLLPQIVERSDLAPANAMLQASENSVGIAGASLAGVVVALLGIVPALMLDAVSFVVGGALVLAIRPSEVRPPSTPPRAATTPAGLVSEIVEGARYLRGQTGLLELTLSALGLNFFTTLVGLFTVIYVAQVLHAGALMFGVLNAVGFAGVVVGGLAAGAFHLTRRAGVLWASAGLFFGASYGALVIAPLLLGVGPWVLATAIAVSLATGVFGGMIGTAWLSTAQAIVPDEFQGRYFSLDNLGSFAATPIAQVTGGLLTAARGVLVTYAVAAIGCLGVGGVFSTRKELRALSYDPSKGGEGRPPVAKPR